MYYSFSTAYTRISKSNFRASRFLHFFSETFSPLIEAIIVFIPFKVSEVRFIFYSFTATLMSSKTAFATSVSELSSGDVIILKSWSFLTVGEHIRSRYSRLSKVLGNVKKNPYIINQNNIFSKNIVKSFLDRF